MFISYKMGLIVVGLFLEEIWNYQRGFPTEKRTLTCGFPKKMIDYQHYDAEEMKVACTYSVEITASWFDGVAL